MAIQKEIWQDHIEGNLFKNNEFFFSMYKTHYFIDCQ